MAAKSNLKNMLLCLSSVCLVCSSLLAVVYAVTKEPIIEAQIAKTNRTIAKVLPEFSADVISRSIEVDSELYQYYEAPGAGYAIVSNTMGFGGTLSLMVGVSDGIVWSTEVLSHNETPGLGAQCGTDEEFISQFRKLDPAAVKIAVIKDGGDIDAITASTITSRAYALAVENALKVYNEIIKGGQVNE